MPRARLRSAAVVRKRRRAARSSRSIWTSSGRALGDRADACAEAGAGGARTFLTVVAPGGGPAGATDGPPAEIDEATLKELEQGRLTRPADLREMLEHRLHRPEDRKSARAALDRALEGDRAAARGVAETVRTLRQARRGGVTRAAAYPEEERFLKEYRRARAEEER